MSLPENLGRLSSALTSDASLNIGVGVTPSGSFKLEVGTTSKFTGVATFGSTLSNGTYTYTLPSATGTLALTSAIPANPVGGTGTTNYLPKFTASTTIGDSLFYDNGTLTAVGNRVSTNSFVGLVRNFNVLGTDAAVRVARYTDSYATLHPTVEMLNYSDDGVYRRFYWDNFVNGSDSYGIRQRLTGGGPTTNGTVIDQTRLTIFSGGNVGINTTTDAGYKLDVNGTVNLSGALSGTSATFSSSIAATSATLTGSITLNTGAPRVIYQVSSVEYWQVLGDASKYAVYNSGLGTYNLWINSSGNVGIGTISPNGPLDVVGPTYGGLYTLSLVDSAAVAADIGGGIYFGGNYTGTTKTGWAGILGRKDNATDGQYGGYMAFQTRTHGSSPAERMRITSGGKVGIGQTSPNYSLTVNGSIQAGYILLGDTANGNNSTIEFVTSPNSTSYGTGTSGNINYYGTGNLSLCYGGGKVLIGTITDNGSKLQVTGAATFSSTIAATSATFSGNIVQSGTSNIIQQSASNSYTGGSVLDIYNISATGYGIYVQGGGTSQYSLSVNNYAGTNLLTILGSGAATFSGGQITLNGATSAFMQLIATTTYAYTQYSSGTNTMYLIQNQNGGTSNGTTAGAAYIYMANAQDFQFNWVGTTKATITSAGNLTIVGALSKGSGSFRIEHPLPSLSKTHHLVHSFIEGPQADLIYRGKLTLVNGKAKANIDEVSTMTEGTFEVLCREIQCFTTNESGWDLVKGKVIGNIIYIESQNESSTDEISWMVIGERKDEHMMDTEWTDENGKVIVEPLKPIEPEQNNNLE